ncbi:ABC transporter ATP-binding protein [Luteibaculum oceani]|uniref:ATP-binding cassette domain-containing protein n=1 Tax=Luteibaculum oceani TaxID=1294296 RepID=A0A5C6V0D1_9FLAO|nr:ATP-binding cassette domain-containing protein [Luteibaculum oceani]TXC78364.1 ATP-binding cassette domain-containing protein [Luteibaculum oceani]
MKIEVINASKVYSKQQIFAGIDFSFSQGKHLITGGNGSGKSTLLRCLSGMEKCSEGNIIWKIQDTEIKREQLFKHIALCAPAIGLYEELTLKELYHLVNGFRPLVFSQFSDFVDALALPRKKILGKKKVSNFSSGMKQRVKLLLALSMESEFVFLDEPASNLDNTATKWYWETCEQLTQNKILVVASNQPEIEAPFCQPALTLNP